MKICEYPHEVTRQQLCPAYAVEGSRYCSAHLAKLRGEKPTPGPRRSTNLDVDLLPYTPDEFQALAELKERTNR